MPGESPNNVRAVVPMLICRDAAAEIDFCKAAFGAVEESRRRNCGACDAVGR